MEAAPHIIGRQKIRLSYTGSPDALALRHLVSRVCSAELPARLDALFSRYDTAGRVLHIGKLDIHVSLLDDGRLEEQLGKAILEQVEIALRRQLPSATATEETLELSFGRALVHYLLHGFLPWWSTTKSGPEFRNLLNEGLAAHGGRELVRALIPLMGSAGARGRLAALLDFRQLEAFVLLSGLRQPDEWVYWKEIIQLLRDSGRHAAYLDRMLAETLLEAAHIARASAISDDRLAAMLIPVFETVTNVQGPELPDTWPAALQTSVAAALKAAATPGVRNRPQQKEGGSAHNHPAVPEPESAWTPETATAISIQNAGLVLLAPYLPQFFKHTRVDDPATGLDKARAIALLRYLVYGDEAFTEFEIALEKILCGIPLQESIAGEYRISREEREEAEALLGSVIEHWRVLKNTSPEGLRQSFLQREGRLVFGKQQWELSIQKQTHDILLDYLPWNVSLTKLPYMAQMLIVKWNS